MGTFQKCSLFSSIGWHTYYVVGVIGAGTHTMSLWHTIFMCAPRATHAPTRPAVSLLTPYTTRSNILKHHTTMIEQHSTQHCSPRLQNTLSPAQTMRNYPLSRGGEKPRYSHNLTNEKNRVISNMSKARKQPATSKKPQHH